MTDYRRGAEIGTSIRRTPVFLPDGLAGERLLSQPTKSYTAVRVEAKVAIISKTTAVTIGGGAANDTHLIAILITKALTGTCVVTGFADSDGSAKSLTFPAATPAKMITSPCCGCRQYNDGRACVARHPIRGISQNENDDVDHPSAVSNAGGNHPRGT